MVRHINNTVLDINKINFSEASLVDDFGRVFFYEGRVFRAIYREQKDHCLTLLNSELFKELLEKQFIPNTWVTEYQLEDYSFILEHEFVHESKPHHWSFSMYKDAALLVLQLNKLCNKHGYELKDAHPFNVFFKKNKPVFIDIGSIAKINSPNKWIAYEEFINSFYLQLLIWNKPDFFLARKLIEDGNHPVQRTIPMSKILDSKFTDLVAEDLFNVKFSFRGRLLHSYIVKNSTADFISRGIQKMGSLILRRPLKSFAYYKELKPLSYVDQKIRSLNRPFAKSYWEHYHNAYKSGGGINSTPRFDRIIQLVKQHTSDSKTATDLAGNQGVFCYLLSQALELDRVVLTDYDEKAVDTAYHEFKNEGSIQPYLFNFMNLLRRDETNVVKSDIAFALAITHHLILTQKYSLPLIFKRIGECANRYVIIEFMPMGLWDGNEMLEVPGWYTVDWFRKEFEQKFILLAEEKLEENRIVFIGKQYPYPG